MPAWILSPAQLEPRPPAHAFASYTAVFGAMTRNSSLEAGFDDLTGAGIMTGAGFNHGDKTDT
jgi:hypothetical protein